jgi:hypothetical protein
MNNLSNDYVYHNFRVKRQTIAQSRLTLNGVIGVKLPSKSFCYILLWGYII